MQLIPNSKIKKATLLKAVNSILLISALLQVVTGVMLYFNLFMRYINSTIAIHKYNGIIFTLVMAAHIYLNWEWLKNQFFMIRR